MCGKGRDGGVWRPRGPRREGRGGLARVSERPWGGGPEERGGLWGGRPEESRGPEESRDLVSGEEGRLWGRESKMGIPGLRGRPELGCWG